MLPPRVQSITFLLIEPKFGIFYLNADSKDTTMETFFSNSDNFFRINHKKNKSKTID
jgi:hypothetical protein